MLECGFSASVWCAYMRTVDGYSVKHRNLTLVVSWCGSSDNTAASESSS